MKLTRFLHNAAIAKKLKKKKTRREENLENMAETKSTAYMTIDQILAKNFPNVKISYPPPTNFDHIDENKLFKEIFPQYIPRVVEKPSPTPVKQKNSEKIKEALFLAQSMMIKEDEYSFIDDDELDMNFEDDHSLSK